MSQNKQKSVFLKRLLDVAVPVGFQNLISSSLNLVDTIMIGALGALSISAVGLANQVYFLLMLVLYGVNSGVSIYIAQYWGKRDTTSIHQTMGLGFLAGAVLILPFFVGSVFFPVPLLSCFTPDQTVIREGVIFLQISGWSFLFMNFSFGYAIAARSIGRAKLPMVASSAALICNTVLNWFLIFGHGGFPKMGVAGAATATLIARILELIILLLAIYWKPHPLKASLKELFHISKAFAEPIVKTALPVVLNEGFWALGMTLYAVAYARSSTDAYAAVQIASTVERLFFVFTFGLGSACSVLIGNELGAGNIALAKDYAKRFLKIGIPISLAVGVLMFIIADPVTHIFNVSEAVRLNAKYILWVNGGLMVLKMLSTLMIIGIFRGGGDTTFSFIIEIACVYLIGVPLAFWCALVLKLPIYWVVLIVATEELVKCIIGLWRVRTGIWAKNLVGEE